MAGPPLNSSTLAALQERLASLGIREDDLVEKFVRSQGPGGQKVNKSSTAVHLKHLPSGIELKVQTSRSQAFNRFLARRRLADKLEVRMLGEASAEAQRVAKIKRQKRKRSRRAKKKMVANKRQRGETKRLRSKPRRDTE